MMMAKALTDTPRGVAFSPFQTSFELSSLLFYREIACPLIRGAKAQAVAEGKAEAKRRLRRRTKIGFRT
jgi:hypothetical protein